MKIRSAFPALWRWLKTELFVRHEKAFPGKWYLFDFYTEQAGELIHWNEQQLMDEAFFWDIEVFKNGDLLQRSNLPVLLFEGSEILRWKRSRLYLRITSPAYPGRYEELQYAVDGGLLKLLKKKEHGEIEIFASFQREKSKG